MRPVAELTAVKRSFGRRAVLRGIDLRLLGGQRVLVAGPNGCGKTTLVRCVAGTLRIDSGSIAIDGHPVGSLAARQLTGTAFAHERSLYERLTGMQNLLLFARLRLRRREAWRTALALVEELDLATIAARPAGELSAGMRAQLAFARALLGPPSLLLLDEVARLAGDRLSQCLSGDQGVPSRVMFALWRP
jgi:ABC-type multidrug transport system ATPase subunit